jgi:hypothetical protein
MHPSAGGTGSCVAGAVSYNYLKIGVEWYRTLFSLCRVPNLVQISVFWPRGRRRVAANFADTPYKSQKSKEYPSAHRPMQIDKNIPSGHIYCYYSPPWSIRTVSPRTRRGCASPRTRRGYASASEIGDGGDEPEAPPVESRAAGLRYVVCPPPPLLMYSFLAAGLGGV